MNAALKALFVLLGPFVSHPERAYLAAALFAALLAGSVAQARRLSLWRHLPLLLAAVVWGGFGLIEQQAMANGWNIRVDLFVTGPIVLAVSIWAAWANLRRGSRRKSDDETRAGSPDPASGGAENRR